MSERSISEGATGTQAVDRAALLLSTVVDAEEPVGFSSLAEECGLPKSTTSRLLTALERTELVERTDEGEYVAGPLFSRFAARRESPDLVRLAQPMMQNLVDVTGETVNLAIALGSVVDHIAQVDSTFLLGTRDWTHVEVPNHASAIAKVLMAAGELPLPDALPALTDHTITDVRRLREVLAGVERDGYAFTSDELEVGLTSVAVPVHNIRGDVVAVLGISGPTARLAGRHRALARLMMDQSAQLTRALGTLFTKEGVA
ncbi:MAG: IclR family transcriptional regulator [Nocardioides sp.]|jgi:IclR family acetate operon transcriptional repressor